MISNLSADQRNAIGRISGLVLVNAMIFQEVLAESNSSVFTLQKVIGQGRIKNAFCKHWKFIIEEINYYPIFHIAREILLNISSNKDFRDALIALAETAEEIVSLRAALRHDLMGRIYHRLLVDKKYLGTYYTSIPAATLLLKLTLQPAQWKLDWSNLDHLEKFKIADLACGTGTLLMAAADAITDNYVSSSAQKGIEINTGKLQNLLAEEVLFGYDVLASAIHLTASTLALRAPEVEFSKTNLYSLSLGGKEARLGSLEYLYGHDVGMPTDVFGAQPKVKRVRGKSITEEHIAPLPKLDLCVMNPPFTRSVGGNLLFGSLPKEERALAQKRLKKLIIEKSKKRGQKTIPIANIIAGLGAVFVATANPHIKERGRIALVLPKALLSGIAWKRTRDLLSRHYRVEYIIASHDPQRWNFSESTSLSEVLIIAQKLNKSQKQKNDNVMGVNLWSNPSTSFESLAIAQSILQGEPPSSDKDEGTQSISIGNKKVGEIHGIDWKYLKQCYSWMLPCSFAQTDLIRSCYHLLQGILKIPGNARTNDLNLCRISDIGVLGPDRHGVHALFDVSHRYTPYAVVWGHDSKSVYALSQCRNDYLSPKSRANRCTINRLWSLSGKVLIAEGIRLNTHRLFAIRTNEKVLSNVWWPLSLNEKFNNAYVEKALTLWLNSTVGILILLIHREETEGPWIGFKKTILETLPIINPNSLSKKQLKDMAETYDRICNDPIQPLCQADSDPIRMEIDNCIIKTLELNDFSILRNMISKEPIISNRHI